jgi:hypothetical protein
MLRNISIYYGRKIKVIRNNNNTKQKLIPDPNPILKHIRIPRKKRSYQQFL